MGSVSQDSFTVCIRFRIEVQGLSMRLWLEMVTALYQHSHTCLSLLNNSQQIPAVSVSHDLSMEAKICQWSLNDDWTKVKHDLRSKNVDMR